MRKKKSISINLFEILNTILIIVALIIVLYPLIYMVSASISDPVLVNQGKVWLLPKNITFEGYIVALKNSDIWTGYRNTIFYTLAGTMINLVVTLLAAYSLSRKDFVGRNFFMAIFSLTMFFSGGLIPTFLVVKNLSMVDKVWVMIILGSASAMNIIISKTFIQSNIPIELQESASIDGCSNTRLFLNIVLPLSTPLIAVMALFYGVGHWNSYFNALIYLKNRQLYPLQLILREILVQQQVDMMMQSGVDMEDMADQAKLADLVKYSVIVISSLPLLVVYPFLQKYFRHGMMVGSIKG